MSEWLLCQNLCNCYHSDLSRYLSADNWIYSLLKQECTGYVYLQNTKLATLVIITQVNPQHRKLATLPNSSQSTCNTVVMLPNTSQVYLQHRKLVMLPNSS